jgi:RHS repeat-associated protein
VVSNWTAGAWSNALSLRFVYDDWNLLGEFNNTNATIPLLARSYAWGTDLSGTHQAAGGVGGLLAVTGNSDIVAGQPSTHLLCYDGNGNVASLVKDSDGSTTAQYEYDPFGSLIRATGPMSFANPYRFSAKYFDDETGCAYYGYRYYCPALGRWTSRDPAEYDPENLYNFVSNDAVSHIDLHGLFKLHFNGLSELQKFVIIGSMDKIEQQLPSMRERLIEATNSNPYCAGSCEYYSWISEMGKMIAKIDALSRDFEASTSLTFANSARLKNGTSAYAETKRSGAFALGGWTITLQTNSLSTARFWWQTINHGTIIIFHELTHIEGTDDDVELTDPFNEARFFEPFFDTTGKFPEVEQSRLDFRRYTKIFISKKCRPPR